MLECSSTFYYVLLIFLLIFIGITFSREDIQTAKELMSRPSTSFLIRETDPTAGRPPPLLAPTDSTILETEPHTGREGAQPRPPPAVLQRETLRRTVLTTARLEQGRGLPFPRLHAGDKSHEVRGPGTLPVGSSAPTSRLG